MQHTKLMQFLLFRLLYFMLIKNAFLCKALKNGYLKLNFQTQINV